MPAEASLKALSMSTLLTSDTVLGTGFVHVNTSSSSMDVEVDTFVGSIGRETVIKGWHCSTSYLVSRHRHLHLHLHDNDLAT